MRVSAGGSKPATALVLRLSLQNRAYHCQDMAAGGLAGGRSYANPKRAPRSQNTKSPLGNAREGAHQRIDLSARCVSWMVSKLWMRGLRLQAL